MQHLNIIQNSNTKNTQISKTILKYNAIFKYNTILNFNAILKHIAMQKTSSSKQTSNLHYTRYEDTQKVIWCAQTGLQYAHRFSNLPPNFLFCK